MAFCPSFFLLLWAAILPWLLSASSLRLSSWLALQVKLTPEQEAGRAYYEAILTHADAVKKYGMALKKYNLWVDEADPETKAFLIENVIKLWLKADETLEAWGSIVEAGKDPDMEIANYKAIKTKILMQIPKLDW